VVVGLHDVAVVAQKTFGGHAAHGGQGRGGGLERRLQGAVAQVRQIARHAGNVGKIAGQSAAG
jgi:hypothetical protein